MDGSCCRARVLRRPFDGRSNQRGCRYPGGQDDTRFRVIVNTVAASEPRTSVEVPGNEHLPDSTVSVAAFRSYTASMCFGHVSRRRTSNARHSSVTSLGRERDRPVRFSIRRNRWRTVLGWHPSRSAAERTDALLSCHTRNVSDRISRSSSGRSSKQSETLATVLTITSGALTAARLTRTFGIATATWRKRLATRGISRGPRRCFDATCRGYSVCDRAC